MPDGYEDLLPKGKTAAAPDGYADLLPPKKQPAPLKGNIGFGVQSETWYNPQTQKIGIKADPRSSAPLQVDPGSIMKAQQEALRLATNPMLGGLQGKPPTQSPRHPSDAAYDAKPLQKKSTAQRIQETRGLDQRQRDLAKLGSGDLGAMAEGAVGIVKGLFSSGTESVRESAQQATEGATKYLQKNFPQGLLLRPELAAEMDKLGPTGKMWKETIKNLDPSQAVPFVNSITRKAEANGESGLAAAGRGVMDIFRRIAEGDENAGAELMGMWNAFAIAGATSAAVKGLKTPTSTAPKTAPVELRVTVKPTIDVQGMKLKEPSVEPKVSAKPKTKAKADYVATPKGQSVKASTKTSSRLSEDAAKYKTQEEIDRILDEDKVAQAELKKSPTQKAQEKLDQQMASGDTKGALKTMEELGTPGAREARKVKPETSSYEDYVKAEIKREGETAATVPMAYQDARLRKFSDDLNAHPERMNPNVYVPGKSGWEVTKKEWVALQPAAYKERAALGHQSSVERALMQGKPVPDAVLADYPDLVKQYKRADASNLPQKTIRATKQAKVAEPPATKAAPEAEDVKPAPKMTTVAHADVDQIRRDYGMSERSQNPETVKGWVEGARKYEGSEGALVARAKKGDHLGPSEEVALGVKLNQLRDKMKQARKVKDDNAWGLAFDEAEDVADALDLSGSRAGRAMRARQVLLSDNYDDFAIMARAKKANAGEPLSEAQAAEIRRLTEEISTQSKGFSVIRKELEAEIERLKKATAPRPSAGVTTRRTQALNRLSKLLPDVERQLSGSVGGGFGSKKRGAVRVPKSAEQKIYEDLFAVTRSYVEEGSVKNFDELLNRLSKDTGLSDDQLLYFMSQKYKKAKLEADVKKLQVDDAIRQIKRDALRREMPAIKKAGQFAVDLLGTGQRAIQAGADASVAMIQGRRLLYANPAAWVRGFGEGIKAAKGGREASQNLHAQIINDPWYPRYKQAGGHLSEIGGAYSKQEEFLASQLLDQMEKHKALRYIAAPWTRSQYFATAMLNKARFDAWKFLAQVDPENPAYLEDIANQINIMSGRSVGRLGNLLSHEKTGAIFYAPNYYGANYQYSFAPYNLATSKTAKGAAAKAYTYAANAVWIIGMMQFAKTMGWEIDTDIRSTNFGEGRIGPYRVDFFGKEMDPVKFVAQMIYGRISEAGNYSGPTKFGNNTFEMYFSNKLAPIPRLGYQATHGVLEEKEEGGYTKRPLAWRDIVSGYSPIAWREIIKGADAPVSAPAKIGVGLAQLAGAGVQKYKPLTGTRNAPPLKLKPPAMDKENF